MENELVIVNPEEFGLNEKTAKTITKGLTQILEERRTLSKQYASVVSLEITEENLPKFKELRLAIRKNRTKGIEAWHKVNKEFYLRGGQFVDAIKRKEIAENIRMEDALQESEKHFEHLEAEKQAKLQEERAAKMSVYDPESPYMDMLGGLSESAFEDILSGTKSRVEREQAEAKKIEDDRIAKEKAEQEERERIAKENEALKKEAEEKEVAAKKEREANDKKAAKEKATSDKKAADLKAKNDKIIADQKEKSDKLAAEIQKRKDAEAKIKEEADAKIEADLKKGDVAKMKDLVADLDRLKVKYEFKSKANQHAYKQMGGLIDKVINYINK